ncbi:tyrosine-type recombinase/integrase [Candidatus Bipolaricaulota bacterium]|nr:tyrosine-type recombinase/integrase [Candidatus Bipolaricaulota bacterium]
MTKRKIPEVLTEEEQRKLIDQFNDRYPTSHRNKMMIQLMLDTGLRLAEAVSLRWKDVNLTSGKVMVREGKGAKDRTLWIGENRLEQLRKWKERQTEWLEESLKHVFTTRNGDSLSPRYVQKMVKNYSEKAEISKNVTPHTLRHTFATDLYRETGKIRLVQKALGHADLSTTMIYTHIVDEELEGAMKSFRAGERQPVGA